MGDFGRRQARVEDDALITGRGRYIELDYMPTSSRLNPVGARGAGQGGAIPVPAALTVAAEDALRPLGLRLTRVPFTPRDIVAGLAPAGARPA